MIFCRKSLNNRRGKILFQSVWVFIVPFAFFKLENYGKIVYDDENVIESDSSIGLVVKFIPSLGLIILTILILIEK